jgi:high-affinity K+ transport system ATPase subunit B
VRTGRRRAALLRRNLLIYGLGGMIAPFIGIKLIDLTQGRTSASSASPGWTC